MGFYGIYLLVMTNIAMEHHHLEWIVPLDIVMFHSYTKLPEGDLTSRWKITFVGRETHYNLPFQYSYVKLPEGKT